MPSSVHQRTREILFCMGATVSEGEHSRRNPPYVDIYICIYVFISYSNDGEDRYVGDFSLTLLSFLIFQHKKNSFYRSFLFFSSSPDFLCTSPETRDWLVMKILSKHSTHVVCFPGKLENCLQRIKVKIIALLFLMHFFNLVHL